MAQNTSYAIGLRDLAEMSHVDPKIADVLRDCAELIDKLDNSGWQDIASAPRDRTFVLAKLAQIEDERWQHLSGRAFVIRHEGKTTSGYDLGWGLFPGMGGVPDSWIAGWMPLPDDGEQ